MKHMKGKSASNGYLHNKYLVCIPSKGNGHVKFKIAVSTLIYISFAIS